MTCEQKIYLLATNAMLAIAFMTACTSAPDVKATATPKPKPTATPTPTSEFYSANFALHPETHTITIASTDSHPTLGAVANWDFYSARGTDNPTACHDSMAQDKQNKQYLDGVGSDFEIVGGLLVNLRAEDVCFDLLPKSTSTPQLSDPYLIARATATAQARTDGMMRETRASKPLKKPGREIFQPNAWSSFKNWASDNHVLQLIAIDSLVGFASSALSLDFLGHQLDYLLDIPKGYQSIPGAVIGMSLSVVGNSLLGPLRTWMTISEWNRRRKPLQPNVGANRRVYYR